MWKGSWNRTARERKWGTCGGVLAEWLVRNVPVGAFASRVCELLALHRVPHALARRTVVLRLPYVGQLVDEELFHCAAQDECALARQRSDDAHSLRAGRFPIH